MKRQSKIIKAFAMLIAAVVYVAFHCAGSALADEKLRMAYISDSPASSAPYWVARDAGIFKKYGLDVDLIFINGSTRGIQSLLAGDLGFTGAVGTSAINGRLAGGDIVIVDSLVNTLPYYIIGKADIKSPEDLRGRTLATHIPGTSADFAVRLALRRFGIDYKDIKAITIGGTTARVAAVMNGQADFTMVTEPGKIEGEKAGLKLIIDMAKLNIPFQFTCTVTTERTIKEQPRTVQNMVKAVAEGVAYYKQYKEQTLSIMAKYTRGLKRSVLEGSYEAYRQLLDPETYPTLEGIKDTLEVQSSWDPKAATAKPGEFVDLRFVNRLKETGFFSQLYGGRTASAR